MLPNVARNDRATKARPTRDASLTLPGEVCVCNTHPGNDRTHKAQKVEKSSANAPHVLLTVSDAAELLRIVTESRPINHDQTELVADLAAIVRRARAIETRSSR